MIKNYTIKTLSIFAMLFFSFYGFSQDPYTFTDDFEGYNVGDYLAKNSSTWTTWSNKPGTSEDTKISDTQASSGTKSVYLKSTAANGGPTDLVFPMPQVYNLGNVVVQTKMFVDNDKGAYFNFQGAAKIGDIYVIDAYFVNDGKFYIFKNRGSVLAINSTYPTGEWFDLKISMDLTINSWVVEINDEVKGVFSTEANSIASIDFYPVNSESVGGNKLSSYYLDDFSVNFTPFEPKDNDGAVLNIFGRDLGLTGDESSVQAELINLGKDTIESIELKWSYGATPSTETKTFSGLSILPLGRQIFDFDTKYTLEEGDNNLTVEILSVNGASDDYADNDVKNINIQAVTPAPDKGFLGEELTGTWCGWCPRGAVAMEYMANKYPNYFVGVAVHGGSESEPMKNDDLYAGSAKTMNRLTSSWGFPGLAAMRSAEMDPSAVEVSFLDKIQEPAVASLTTGAFFNNTTRRLSVSISTAFKADDSNKYNVALILVENNVTGTGSGYAQQNYYSKQSQNRPLVGAGHDWQAENKVVPASKMSYEDVGRACIGGYDGVSLGNSHTTSDVEVKNFVYTVPEEYNADNLYLVAVLINEDGTVNNANKISLADAMTNGFVEIYENIAYHDLVINEFVASNDSVGGVADQDGEYDDWIEIYNNTNDVISLSNAYLSDDFNDPQTFQFPEATYIDPASYIIVWADKDTDQEGFHAKMKLKSSGEELIFTNGDGSVIDSVSFGEQTTNIAMARVPNGTGDFILQEPTFKDNNNLIAVFDLQNNKVTIYPNPAANILNIKLDDFDGNYSVNILNQFGQTILTKTNNNSEINISSLENGFYFIQIVSDNKIIGNAKFTVFK